jgi:two-component sensor histidine kinase
VIPNSGWSLRLRLLLSVGLVLLVPALLGIMQGVTNARRDVQDLRERLTATALAAVTPAQNVLVSAREIARALSRLPDVRDASAGCNADLASVLRGMPFLTNIVRVDPSGRVICAAQPKSIGMSAANLSAWRTISTAGDFVVNGVSQSRLMHRSVVVGLLPLRDSAHRFRGALNIAIDVRWLNDVLKTSRLPSGSVMAIFDHDRNMIASTNDGLAHTVLLRAPPPNRFRTAIRAGKDEKGDAWTYATASLLGPDVYVALAMPDTKLFGLAYSNALIDFLLPIAMILLTWLAIWIVTDRQMTRWIIYLRRVSAAYRRGHYALRPSLEGAPSELKLLGDALAQMAESIHERDRSLRDAVAQKTSLIKEIHHRVKNNLQVVMSLLSLQARRLKDPVAIAALDDTRSRINALALVHRILYEIDDQRSVDVKSLLEQLAEQTSEGFVGGRCDVKVVVDAAARSLPSEMALPISLFTVEAMTNAFKHAFPEGRSGTIRIRFALDGEHNLHLAVADDGIGFDFREAQSTVGARLMQTFGRQIGGELNTYANDNAGITVEIVFPDPAYLPGVAAAS